MACDLNDVSWFEKIDASGGAVFFAAGVFYYFLTDQVRALVCKMAEAFPGGRLVFDGAGKAAVKLMLKTWIQSGQHSGRGRVFRRFRNARERSWARWSPRLRVSSRGYMLGYQDLKDPSVSGFFRFLARVGDGGRRCRSSAWISPKRSADRTPNIKSRRTFQAQQTP